MAKLTVDVPAELIAVIQAEADDRGVTVDGLVQEAFRHLNGRIEPDMLEAGGAVIA